MLFNVSQHTISLIFMTLRKVYLKKLLNIFLPIQYLTNIRFKVVRSF